MDAQQINKVVEVFLDKASYTLITGVLALLAILFTKNIASSIFLFLKARFSEIGVGALVIVEGDIYSVDKIRWGFVELRNLQASGVIMRLPLSTWDSMPKKIKYQRVKFDGSTDMQKSDLDLRV